ncbi:hypothetical protein PRIPAC_70484 [Pristionchus pacificus]|uniref:Uncharacterized protein n=1 Tax=Pristionchus pacificus TaxID=54126 RepID=A0A2A6C645_PRIPA|nr:hypothetical protein PRIPAC_70484 [Pristionchus pacificus]|eukprot:PDM73645.1 hypothetical protein PRIPAC_41001 [Pristionchus pacificus]
MAQNGTADQWTIDQARFQFYYFTFQTDLFDKLDIAFTLILGVAGILTFPPACFVYWRILTLKGFQGQYLMKLFVINGFSVRFSFQIWYSQHRIMTNGLSVTLKVFKNMLMYIVNLIAVQFSNWPSMFGFYSWLKATILTLFLRFLQDYSISLMWQTMFFISLNRLLALKNQYLLSKYDFHYFILASLSSGIFSAIISFPLFFSHYTYYQFSIADGIFAYIPHIPPAYKWTSAPAQICQLSLAVATMIINAIICVFVVKMRKEYSAKMKSRPEQGLLLSSVIAVLSHILNDILLAIATIYNEVMFAYFITLTVAVATTLPFWTMMICAKTMRRAVLNGTGFDAIRSSTVRIRSATRKSAKSASAAF